MVSGGWKRDGSLHRGIEGFFLEKEPMRLTLHTMGSIEVIRAQRKQVYVVENPAVFSVLTARYPECAAVCINGQPRLAALLLLDSLKGSHRFFYAGDFDPEGILIAQRLKERYGESLHLWKYDKKWYLQFLSEVELNPRRLKKLEQVYIDELLEIRECMKKKKARAAKFPMNCENARPTRQARRKATARLLWCGIVDVPAPPVGYPIPTYRKEKGTPCRRPPRRKPSRSSPSS